MRRRRIVFALAASAALVLVLAIGAVVAAERASFDALRPRLESRLSSAIGREVRIESDIHLDVALRPRLVAERVSVANPRGWPSPRLLEIARLELLFRPLRLLAGELDVEALRLRDVKLLLERDARGAENWVLPGLRDVEGSGERSVAVRLRDVRFEGLTVTWRDEGDEQEWIVAVDQLAATHLVGEGPLELEASGAIRDEPFRMAVRLARGLAPGEPQPTSLEARLFGVDVEAEGSVSAPKELEGVNLRIRAILAETQTLAQRLGWTLPPLGPLTLSGQLTDAQGELGLRDLEARIGAKEGVWVSGRGDILDLDDLEQVSLALSFGSPDLRPLAALLGLPVGTGGSVHGAAQLNDADGELDVEDLEVTVGGRETLFIEFAGALEDVLVRGPVTVAVELAARDLGKVGELLGRELPALGPVVARGKLRRSADGIGLEDLEIRLGDPSGTWARASGQIRELFELTGVELDGELGFPDPSLLADALDASLPDLGPLQGSFALRDADGSFGLERFRLGGGSPGLRFDVSGTIDDLARIDEIEVEAELRATDLTRVGQLADLELMAVGPLEFRGNVRGSDERLRARGVVARIGDTRLTGDFEASFAPGARPRLSATIESPQIALQDVGIAPDGEPPHRQREQPAESGEPFDLGWLRGFEAEVGLRAERVTGASGLDVADLGIRLALDRGDLRLHDLQLRLPQGYVKGSARLDASQEPPFASLTFEARGLDLGRTIAQLSDDPILTGTLDVEADLRSRPDTLEAILPTLEGELAFLVEGGTAGARFTRAVAHDLVRTLTSREWRDDTQEMRCMLASFAIDEGVATPKVLVLDAEYLTLVGDGSFDLGRNALDVTVRPKLWSPGFLALAATVELTGPITEPRWRVVPSSLPLSAFRNLVVNARRVLRLPRFRGVPEDLPDLCKEALQRAEQVPG